MTPEQHKERENQQARLKWLEENLAQSIKEEGFARSRKERQEKLMLRVGYAKKPKHKQEQIRRRHYNATVQESQLSEVAQLLGSEIGGLRREIEG